MGDAVLQAFQDSLLGGSAAQVDPSATAAVETSMYGLCQCALRGIYNQRTHPLSRRPSLWTWRDGDCSTCGNAVYRIDVAGDGLDLVAASGF